MNSYEVNMDYLKIQNFLAWSLAIMLGVLGCLMVGILVMYSKFTLKHLLLILGVFSMSLLACPATPFLKNIPMWQKAIAIGILGCLM